MTAGIGGRLAWVIWSEDAEAVASWFYYSGDTELGIKRRGRKTAKHHVIVQSGAPCPGAGSRAKSEGEVGRMRQTTSGYGGRGRCEPRA